MQLAFVLVGAREQTEVVCMMPIERRGDIFAPVVGVLECFGFQKYLDGFLGPPHAPQFMTVHMLRVRDLRRHSRVDPRLFERVCKFSLVLIAVRQEMMRGKIVRRDRQRPGVVRNRRSDTASAISKGRGLFGMAAKQ